MYPSRALPDTQNTEVSIFDTISMKPATFSSLSLNDLERFFHFTCDFETDLFDSSGFNISCRRSQMPYSQSVCSNEKQACLTKKTFSKAISFRTNACSAKETSPPSSFHVKNWDLLSISTVYDTWKQFEFKSSRKEGERATRLFSGQPRNNVLASRSTHLSKDRSRTANLNQRRMCCEVCVYVWMYARKARVIKTLRLVHFCSRYHVSLSFWSLVSTPPLCNQYEYLSYTIGDAVNGRRVRENTVAVLSPANS